MDGLLWKDPKFGELHFFRFSGNTFHARCQTLSTRWRKKGFLKLRII